jgi:hypothetical protein
VADPGEVNQRIGRAYQLVFIAALEAHIRGFENRFTVEKEPEKTSFETRSGKSFSFDFCGVHNDGWRTREVFGESKGYARASDLRKAYKLFLARAYVASTDYPRSRNDLFWFVTNVPFACREGSSIRTLDFVKHALCDDSDQDVREILGDGHVDDMLVLNLTQNLGVFILTDSYLMNADLSYKVASGDSLWTIMKRFHAGCPPPNFGTLASSIAASNDLQSPDQIRSGKRIRFPWLGIGLPPLSDISEEDQCPIDPPLGGADAGPNPTAVA